MTSVLSNETTPQRRGFLGEDTTWHLSFGILLAGAFLAFSWWTFDYVDSTASKSVLVAATVLGMFMAFNIGGNDVANSFGTSVGAGTLTMKQALLVAAVFEVSGGIVGGALMLGFVSGQGDSALDMVQWDQIGQIAISWVLSPLLGGVVAYLLYGVIKRHILSYNDEADVKLAEIRKERIEHRNRHKEAFERLSEIQQIAYTGALARDAVAANRTDFDPDELESDYYRELHDIDAKS